MNRNVVLTHAKSSAAADLTGATTMIAATSMITLDTACMLLSRSAHRSGRPFNKRAGIVDRLCSIEHHGTCAQAGRGMTCVSQKQRLLDLRLEGIPAAVYDKAKGDG